MHIDFGEINGTSFFLFVDSFSRWLEIYVINDMQASILLKCLQNIFARYGIAETLVSDNGLNLIASELEDWLFKLAAIILHVLNTIHRAMAWQSV